MKKLSEEKLPMFMTPEQASKISGIGINQLRYSIKEGEITYLPIGNRKLITTEALQSYYERKKVSTKKSKKI